MATVGERTVGDRDRSVPSGIKGGRAATVGGRSLLGLLVGRALSRLASWIGPVGRFSLYVGLLLVAFTALRLPGGTGTLADVFILVSIICATLLLIQGRPLKIGLLKTHAIGLGLLVAGIAISTLAESSDDWQSLLRLGKFLFATTATIVACTVLLQRRSQLTAALGCWVVSAAITSVVAMVQAGFGDPLISDDPLRGRMIGLSENPNGLGTIAAMAMAGGLTLAATSNRLKTALWGLATLLCVSGVVVSASRAGAIVAVVSLAVWGTMFYRLQREFTMLVLGCCLAAAAASSFVFVQVWSGGDVSSRLASATDPYEDAAVANRLYQYEDVLRDALQNPLVGVGLAESEVEVHGVEIHNTFLMLFYAGGLFSLAGLVVIVGDLLLKGIESYRRSESHYTKGMAAAFFVGTVGLTLSGMAGPVLYQRRVWIPAALLLTTLALTQSHARRRSRVSRQDGRSPHPRKHRGNVAVPTPTATAPDAIGKTPTMRKLRSSHRRRRH